MNKNALGIYNGPSQLDGTPIVVIAVGGNTTSGNGKTGDMIQVYILRLDMPPFDAAELGFDDAICGGCTLRPILAKALAKATGAKVSACYVDKIRGPNGIWKSFTAGNIATVTPAEARRRYDGLTTCDTPTNDKGQGHARSRCRREDHGNKPLGIRHGAYGDPASVPIEVWDALLGKGKHTSYTHQWETAPSELMKISMASIDSQTWPDVNAAVDKAKAMGLRWYRVLKPGEAKRDDERMCPEASGRTNCAKCGLCNGDNGTKFGIVIPAIGG